VWIFATRNRPENCKRFIGAWIKTKASTSVYVRIDDDDSTLDELKSLPWPKEFKVVVGKREGLRAAMQELYLENPNEPWYGLLADDLVPQTENWDILLAERAGNKNISYPNDLGGKPKLPTHPVVGGDLTRALGWFGFPVVQHLYVDTVYQYIGNQLGNLYRMNNVIVEHVHPFWNKTNSDKIYSENKQRAARDKEKYLNWVATEGPTVIDKLKKQGF
jgi:hypothetical protein